MNQNVIEFLNENHKGATVELGEKMNDFRETLNSLLEEIVKKTQEYQLNKKYDEALLSIKAQEEISKILSSNEDLVEELLDQIELQKDPDEMIVYGDYKADESVPYTLKDNFKFKRPYKFELGNHTSEISTWKEMLINTCEYLNSINSELFESFADDKSMKWGDTYNFSKDPEVMRGPVKIPNSDVYVETTKDSIAVRQLVAKMLDKYNIDKDSYKVYIRADYTDRRIQKNK